MMGAKYVGQEFYEYLKRHVRTNTILTRPDGKQFVYNAETQIVSPVERQETKKDEFDEWFEKL